MVPGGDGNGATGAAAPSAAEPAPGTGRGDADISALSYFTVDSVGTPSGASAIGGGSRAANVDLDFGVTSPPPQVHVQWWSVHEELVHVFPLRALCPRGAWNGDGTGTTATAA
jgi:hypothetical protein